jgi:acyl-CoA:6-aminopenicillanic acid acyl transferase
MKKLLLMGMIFVAQVGNACTGFGIITQSGTLIGRNRDYFYDPQKFERMSPSQQFNNWYENNYHHNNEFYALTSKNNVSMGVNQNGLIIIEEDSPLPKDAKQNRRFQQPENGTSEGMIKYGILQNFNTVDEIIPFISKIFSMAEPHFYQIADNKKILTVEVAYGDNNIDLTRKFTYQILSKPNDYFAHTNHYLTPEFTSLNTLRSNPDSDSSSLNRLKIITDLISFSKVKNMNTTTNWLMDTSSHVSNHHDVNSCQNTSLFRSDLQEFKSVDLNTGNNKIYGTVSSMIVSNNGNLNNSYITLRMIESITVDRKNKQLIKYKELHTSLSKLFTEFKPTFYEHKFTRSQPENGICT